ncbi:hypothetical protein BH20VER1_BH20VER1_05590 [soil metagenome]
MLLGLFIYCYATGTFASRRIEALTFHHVAVRYLCANTHPDHDTICEFRRQNQALLGATFVRVLELASELKLARFWHGRDRRDQARGQRQQTQRGELRLRWRSAAVHRQKSERKGGAGSGRLATPLATAW